MPEASKLVGFAHCQRCRTVTTGLRARNYEHPCRGRRLPDGSWEFEAEEWIVLPIHYATFRETGLK